MKVLTLIKAKSNVAARDDRKPKILMTRAPPSWMEFTL